MPRQLEGEVHAGGLSQALTYELGEGVLQLKPGERLRPHRVQDTTFASERQIQHHWTQGGKEMSNAQIPGYTYGSAEVATSPVSVEDFELLKQTVLFGEEDE